MERWSGSVALVTGASAGIGAAVARALCLAGVKVVACARRIEKIPECVQDQEEDVKKRLFPYKCDLANTGEICELFEWIKREPQLGGVNLCVANAGLSYSASLLHGTVDEWTQMLQVNVLALNLCTQLAFKSMLERNVDDGHVIFINSISGHRVPANSPGTRFYSATKFAVTGLLEGWRQEIRSLGKNHLRVSQISPGLVETEFSYVMNSANQEIAKQLYASIDCLHAKDIADSVLHVLSAPRHVQIHDIIVRPTEQVG